VIVRTANGDGAPTVNANGRLSVDTALKTSQGWHRCLIYDLADGPKRLRAPKKCTYSSMTSCRHGVERDRGLAGLAVADDESRWPRSIGMSASIALRPVAIGSCIDLRGMMPGALTSTRLRSPGIGPLSSIGLPSASTTRPSRPLPTGTSTMAPVRLTVWPSLISRSLRRSRCRRCRFRDWAPCRACLSRTRPSRRPRRCQGRRRGRCRRPPKAPGRLPRPPPPGRNFLIWSLRIEEISAARMSIRQPPSFGRFQQQTSSGFSDFCRK
jgi:hypothetical protein